MQSETENSCMLQQANHKNPVQGNRRPTNSRFILVFVLIIFIWFAVGIQAFARAATDKLDNDLIKDEDYFLRVSYRCINLTLAYLSPSMETFDKVFLFSLFFGGMSVFNCIILIKTFTRAFVYISLLIFVICLLTEFSLIVTLATNVVMSIADISILVCLCICVAYAITVLFCVHKVGLNTLCDIVKMSTRAIIDRPSTLLFTLAIVTLEILVIVFAINALKMILSMNDSTFWTVSFSLIIVTGGIVISAFVILFAMAVISEFTVNWAWMTKEISSGSILQSIMRIARNHSGTIALESTLIVSFIYAIVRTLRYRSKSARTTSCGNNYIDTVAKATLACTIVHSSLIHTSIYGSNFTKATKKTIRLVASNSPLYLATIEIYNMIAVIGIIGNTIVMFFTAYAMVRLQHIRVHNMPLPFFWGFYIPVIAYCILMTSVGRALMMNKMIMLSAEKDLKESPEVV